MAAGLGIGAYALIATGSLDLLLQPGPSASEPAPGGVIDVSVTPADAQIFVFVGRGPAVSEGLAVGGAHEFIVFEQGLRPSRAVVPQDATWSTTNNGPLYELAVQARPADGPADAIDLGAPRTAPSAPGDATIGTVRVITNPPSAKVYRFIGTGPGARVSVSSIHEGQEILVYRPGYETRRAVIGPSDWQRPVAAQTYGASLAVQLPALPELTATQTLED